ncbi:OFA family MFS transporter [Desulfobacterales bacterium HSG16]|nr:OFA family MFS transporter [Desulfobacterales bacterium HSG16]
MAETIKNKGWTVTSAGVVINLALGILYTWSIFKSAIKTSIEQGGAFQWDPATINDPYAVCCLVFAFSMILAGKCQDKFGPRITGMMGGILVGIGFIWISQTSDYGSWIIGFGVLVGMGIGFGYSSATPPALKWFAPEKTGLIAGLVVSGFGLASVYIAPLAKYLLGVWGLQQSMLFFGVAFIFVVCGASLFLVNPPPKFTPPRPKSPEVSLEDIISYESSFAGWFMDENLVQSKAKKNLPATVDMKPSQMLKTIDFYILWLIYLVGAGSGLMVIGSVAGMAKASMGEMAFLVVAIMAIGNAGGRIIAGILTDKIGPITTLAIMLSFQALLMFAGGKIIGADSAVLLVLLATFIGFNYGTNLSLFPLFTKTLWGLKNFGINYGMVFTAWGVGGFIMSRLSQMLASKTGSYNTSFFIAGVFLIIGVVLTFVIRARLAKRMV